MTQLNYAKKLRAEMEHAMGPEKSTILRFEYVHRHGAHTCLDDGDQSDGKRYSYAAIFAGGRWYITGGHGFFGANSFTHGDFVADVLANEHVENVALAAEFEAV